MTIHTRVSGVWKNITGVHVKVSGVWKEVLEGWVNVSGTWKQFYSSLTLRLTNLTLAEEVDNPSSAIASITVRNDGSITTTGDASSIPPSDTWVNNQSSGVGDDYEVRMVTGSGDSFDTGTMDTWLPLTGNRAWSVTQSGEGSKSGSHTLEIREGSSGSAEVSSTITISLTVNPGGA